MKALQRICYSRNCDIVGFVETAGGLCCKVHFAWLLHSPSFYWIFLNSIVFSQSIFGERVTALSVDQQLK